MPNPKSYNYYVFDVKELRQVFDPATADVIESKLRIWTRAVAERKYQIGITTRHQPIVVPPIFPEHQAVFNRWKSLLNFGLDSGDTVYSTLKDQPDLFKDTRADPIKCAELRKKALAHIEELKKLLET